MCRVEGGSGPNEKGTEGGGRGGGRERRVRRHRERGGVAKGKGVETEWLMEGRIMDGIHGRRLGMKDGARM